MKSLLDNAGQREILTALLPNKIWSRVGPQPLGPAMWDWSLVTKVLVIRLRSIGDAVLSTPSLYALRRFLPHARIDILLEDWVAPVLDGLKLTDNVIKISSDNTSRARAAWRLREAGYDVAYNLHGGTTASFLTRASGATHRVGYANYQYSRFNNHAAPPASELWATEKTHSVEQQLALLGWTGVPVSDRPRTCLAVTPDAVLSVSKRLRAAGIAEDERFALLHPAAAFATKQWAVNNFARVVEHLASVGISSVAIAARGEEHLLSQLQQHTAARIVTFTDLSLQEVTALAKHARVFAGNDSGIAHIAAAVGAPSVVIFGSSNIVHWHPWASAPAEVVREELPCQPCPGYYCAEFERPECIRRVSVPSVTTAIDRVLEQSAREGNKCRN